MSLSIVAGYGSKLHALTCVNEPPREHIPGRRRRLVVLLTLAAVIGLAAAAVVAVSARDDGSQPAVAAASCRALSGRPPPSPVPNRPPVPSPNSDWTIW